VQPEEQVEVLETFHIGQTRGKLVKDLDATQFGV
jgi:hypothetical protein